MTHTNKDLIEKPDHGHYAACAARMKLIETQSFMLMKYTVSMCLGLVMLSLFTLRFAVISWIPSLLGESTDVAPLFAQIFIILIIAVLSMLNCGRWKFCGVILFGLYIAMTIFGFISVKTGTPVDKLTIALGGCGCVFSFMMLPDYLDWKQMSETEGFPQFSLRLAEQNDNPVYKPVHTGEDAADTMSSPEMVDPLNFSGASAIAEMPGIAEPKVTVIGENDYVFSPAGGKHCAMSESPIKTA